MQDNLKMVLTGYAKYRGAGFYAFLLHRVSGLATLFFLTFHVVMTSTVFFVPQWYDLFLQLLRNPLVMMAEIILAFLVIYHGVNGLRIAYIDLFRPDLWETHSTRKLLPLVPIIAFLLWLPVLGIMGYDLLKYGFGFFIGE